MPAQLPKIPSPTAEIRGGAVIVAAFEPFEGRRKNRSWEAVSLVRAEIERVRLPVEFARLPELVAPLAARASVLLLVGEARRRALSIERRAQNLIACRIADNAGARPDGPIDAAGPGELAATWDAERVLAAARAAGAPAELSDDAGGFCCNAALYHALAAAPPTARVGFLHVPIAPQPPLEVIARAIEAILGTMST
ncbi:MAG: pyroglutamyl-peptidase I [Acidobacteriota bacterium]